MTEHSDIPKGEIHGIINWEVTSTAARDALTVATADEGKICHVVGDQCYILVSAIGPTWESLTATTPWPKYVVADLTALAALSVTAVDLRCAAFVSSVLRVYVLTSVGPNVWTGIDDYARNRSNHTGTQLAATISNFNTSVLAIADATGAAATAQAYAIQRSNHTGTQLAATISNFNSAASAAAPVQSVNGATGTVSITAAGIGAVSTGDIGVTVCSLSGGKVPAANIPDIAIVQYLGTVASQAAMLALTGQYGDWCIRSDDGKVYIITGATPSLIGSWTALSYPVSPVVSVNGLTGTVVLTAASIGAEATGVAATLVGTHETNMHLFKIITGAVNTTYAHGDKVLVISGSSTPGPSLPASPSNGQVVEFQTINCSAVPGGIVGYPVTVTRNGSTINGSATDYVMKSDGYYRFTYGNGTWNVTFASKSLSSIRLPSVTSIQAEVNRTYFSTNGTITLPTSGMADGDTVTVVPYTPGTTQYAGAVVVASASTRYIRAFNAGGTSTSLTIDILTTTPADATYTFVWNATDGCWYYRRVLVGPTYYSNLVRWQDSSKTSGMVLGLTPIAGVTDRTLTMQDFDINLGLIPAYNNQNSNTKPAGTAAAIVAGQSNTAPGSRQVVSTGKNFAITNLPDGAHVVVAEASTAVITGKVSRVVSCMKAEISGTSTAYPTAGGGSSSTGTSGSQIPATFANPTGTHAIATHICTWQMADTNGKVASGQRKFVCRYDGTTYTLVSTSTIGTDDDPNTMTPTITGSISNGYLVIGMANGAGAGFVTRCSYVLDSTFNGG